MVENTFEHNGKTSCERRYYISSAVLLAVVFANAVRCHWHIENRLHWVLVSGCENPQKYGAFKRRVRDASRWLPGLAFG